MNSTLTVEATDAPKVFADLIGRVSRGERVVIAEQGKPVGVMVPVSQSATPPLAEVDLAELGRKMLERRDRIGPVLDGITVRELIEEGRM